MRRAGGFLLAATALGVSFAAAAASFPYRVLQRISLSGVAPVQALTFGPGGKHLYALTGDELRTYDPVSGEPGAVVKLPGTGVAIVATARDGGALYVATRAPIRLVVLAIRPLRIESTTAIGGGEPSELLSDRQTSALYLESRAGHTVARLDPKTGKALGVVRLQGRLEQMAANGRGMLYVANATGNELEAIETDRMTRAGAVPLAGCTAPTGLAMDPVGRRLFVACSNGEALVVDEDMGMPFVRLPIERAGRLRTVFAFHPLGPSGWKGGAFMAGDGPSLDSIKMKAFISYVGGGSMPIAGQCTALAVSPAAQRLALVLAPRAAAENSGQAGVASAGPAGEAPAAQLWLLGSADGDVSR